MKIRKCLLVGLACGLCASALAGEKIGTAALRKETPSLKLKWVNGLDVSVCSSLSGKCAELKMPKSVGLPTKVIVKRFIPAIPLSWLAINSSQVHLCTIGRAEPTVHCVRISDDFVGLDLDVNEAEGTHNLRWSVQGALKTDRKFALSNDLITSFGKARSQLTLLNESTKRTEMKVSATKASGIAPVLAVIASGEGGCGTDEEGEIECEGGDGGGGGEVAGGGSGGGGGESGQIPIPLPPPPLPVPALPVDPYEPTDPNAPIVIISRPPADETPWYCRLFGLFCPGESAPVVPTSPPPPNPIPPSEPTAPTSQEPIPRYREGYEEAIKQCEINYNADMDECNAYFGAFGSQTWLACKGRAGENNASCIRNAHDAFIIR